LKRRAAELTPAIQMCDALSRNVPKFAGGVEILVANCLAHGRRQFVNVAGSFPDECLYVLEALGKVYGHEAVVRERSLAPPERLRFDQEHRGPVMQELHRWLEAQLAEHKTEPNSGLGKAITYLSRHWNGLTAFLREPRAPLDKAYASYCTSCEPCTTFSGKRRRSESLVPCALRGGSGPGSSYRNRFLSLTG